MYPGHIDWTSLKLITGIKISLGSSLVGAATSAIAVYADIRSGSQDLCKFSLDFTPAPVFYVYMYFTLFSLSSSIVFFTAIIYQRLQRAVKCGTSGDVASGVAKCDPQSSWNPRKNCGSFVGGASSES